MEKGKSVYYSIFDTLDKLIPEPKSELEYSNEFELLIAVMLSAQCTDERVNKTTPGIFAKYNRPEHFANMDIHLLEQLIHPCGFYKNKAKNIKSTSQIILNKYNGNVPNTIEDLISLPGVGRKTANVVMLEAFNNPQGVAVDTHCKRISNRIGFSKETDPEKIEKDLLKLFSKEYYYDLNHILIWHGRNICTSRNPKCNICPIANLCKNYNNNNK